MPVTIEVGDANAKHRGELRFGGKRNRLKVVATIEQKRRREGGGLKLLRGRKLVTQKIRDR